MDDDDDDDDWILYDGCGKWILGLEKNYMTPTKLLDVDHFLGCYFSDEVVFCKDGGDT